MYGLDSERGAVSVSLRHLKLFESVARLSSVRRASEECHLSQPAVTQALAKLEAQIGVGLLERGASGSHLNELGAIFQRRTGLSRPCDGQPHYEITDPKPDFNCRKWVICPGGTRAFSLAGNAEPRRP